MSNTSGTRLPISSERTSEPGRSRYSLDVSEVPEQSLPVSIALLVEQVCGDGTLTDRPLCDSVDPDALDALFDPPGGDASGVSVSFTHGDCRIRVEGGERIEVVEDA
ncbi:MAG: HalOD1 output domain-containing protein [Haloferacaceae archaeon]